MAYQVILSTEATNDLRSLSAYLRAEVRNALDRFLRHQPTRVSRSRIKHLRGLSRPEYRLRVGDLRIYYDVVENRVEVLAIVSKELAGEWLAQEGVNDEGSRPD